MPPLSRRTTLRAASVAGVLGVSGCELGDGGSRRRPPPAVGADASATPTPDREGDLIILDEVRAAVAAAAEAVRATGQRHRALRRRLRALLGSHDAHLAQLAATDPAASTSPETTGTAPATGSSVSVPARPAKALSTLRRAERALETILAESAVRAASGDFARLLASMSAAVAQQVVLLTPASGDAEGGR